MIRQSNAISPQMDTDKHRSGARQGRRRHRFCRRSQHQCDSWMRRWQTAAQPPLSV